MPEKTPAASPTMLSAVVVAEADEDESREYSMGSGCSDDASSATEEERRLQLADSLSASYPGMSLSAALHNMAAGPGVVGGSRTEDDPLSNSCYAAIRLERGPLDDEEEDDDNDVPLQLPDTTMPCQLAGRDTTVDGDDDLTSLAWLQDSNLLKNIGGKGRLCPSPPADVTDDDEDEAGGEGKENGAGSKICATVTASTLHPQQHPSHIPYNPLKHVNSKPPYSFSCLIFMAIEDAPDKRLPVKDIYSWILSHFPYFQSAPTGWKNSVRHNLSLNKCFKKVDKDKGSNIGKGSYWCIDPEFRPNLLQALRKTPYHPYHQLQMMSSSVMPGVNGPMKLPLAPRVNGATVSPHLFPFLSRRLAQSGHAIPSASASSSDLTSDIEVANALVSLKSPSFISSSPHHQARSKAPTGGVRSRSPSPPEFGSEADRRRKAVATRRRRGNPPSPVVITEVPSEDHTYIASTSANAHGSSPASSSIDGEYEFGCRRHGSGHNEDDSCHSEHTDYDDEDRDASNYDDEDAEDEFDSEEDEEEMEVDGCVDHLPASQSPEVVHGKEIDGIDALLNLASIATSVMENAFREEVVM